VESNLLASNRQVIAGSSKRYMVAKIIRKGYLNENISAGSGVIYFFISKRSDKLKVLQMRLKGLLNKKIKDLIKKMIGVI
jgi:hypothetical protein